MGRKTNTLRAKQSFRLKLVVLTTFIVFCGLLCRLYYLQIMSHDDLQAAAVSQYGVTVEGLDTRGQIFDRDMQPVTGGAEQYLYFLESGRLDDNGQKLLSAISARKISQDSAGGKTSRYTVYRSQIFDRTVNRRLKEEYGAYVLCTTARCSDQQLACHLVGYLNEAEKRGVFGLEKACESVLAAENRSLTLWADSRGRLLGGVSPVIQGRNHFREDNLVTTLDSGLQRACESALSERGYDGAILVSDAESGQVLAWASSPVFNPNLVADYLESGGDFLVDKCIQGTYAPGSVFKTVVAAAALESGKIDPEKTYVCSGTEEVGGITLSCELGPEGGHGEVDMKEAMAVSCNCYFAVLGEKIGAERILDMARSLGLGSRVFSRFDEEETGNLPLAESLGKWDISNLSIGQGQLLVTPAQIQRMMSVIACGGRWQQLSVIKGDNELPPAGTSGSSGSSGASDGEQILSEDAAAALEEMLLAVMKEGTGKSGLRTVSSWGKTGTAESVRGGEEVNDCWFSGYCQVGDSRLVVTVLVEQGVSGSTSALPIFNEIADYVQVRQLKVN